MYNDDYTTRARMRRSSCGCSVEREPYCPAAAAPRQTWGLSGYPLASVYAPLQKFHELYDLDTALKNGTVFKELDLPFVCGGNSRGGGCRG